MRIGFALVCLVLAAGCAVKTASMVDPNKQITQPQLKQEAAAIKAQLTARRAVIEERAATFGASLDKEVAVLNADTLAANETLAIANADLAEKYEARNYIFNTVADVVQAAVPAPWGALAGVGLGLAGLGFGFVRQRQATTANTQTSAVVTGVANAPITAEQKAAIAATVKTYATAMGVEDTLNALVDAKGVNVTKLPAEPARDPPSAS